MDTQQLGGAALGDLVLGGPVVAEVTGGTVNLAGSVTQSNDLTGTLTVIDAIVLTGTLDQPNDLTGTLSVSGGDIPLTGTIDQPNDLAGTLSVQNPAPVDLTGSIDQPNDLTGSLTIAAILHLTGVIDQPNDILGGLTGLPPAPAAPPDGFVEARILRSSILMGV